MAIKIFRVDDVIGNPSLVLVGYIDDIEDVQELNTTFVYEVDGITHKTWTNVSYIGNGTYNGGGGLPEIKKPYSELSL